MCPIHHYLDHHVSTQCARDGDQGYPWNSGFQFNIAMADCPRKF